MQISLTQRLKNWWRRSLHGCTVPEQDPLINTFYRHYGIRPSPKNVPAKWWGKFVLFVASKKTLIATLLSAFLILLGLIKDWIPAIPEHADEITREWFGWTSNQPLTKDHVVPPKK